MLLPRAVKISDVREQIDGPRIVPLRIDASFLLLWNTFQLLATPSLTIPWYRLKLHDTKLCAHYILASGTMQRHIYN